MKKLRDKKTRKTGYLYANKDVYYQVLNENDCPLAVYSTLSRLMEDWEEYEEPKAYWRITDLGELKFVRLDRHHQNIEKCKKIGNYFETAKEAERVVKKLQAFKRLKDKGLEFEDVDIYLQDATWSKCELSINAIMPADAYTDKEVARDLSVCFEDEE